MTAFKKGYLIFLIGAVGYMLLEILWRGYTHISMGILGGLCLLMIFAVNLYMKEKPLYLKALVCALLITAAEFLAGLLLNIVLKLSVWDYSSMPFNILGQICPTFTLVWFLLSFAVLWIKNKLDNFKKV